MSRAEVIENIGTIAKSGSKAFLSQFRERTELPPELIGQFGVGSYLAFMVAEKIEIVSRHAGGRVATRWESAGDGSYTLGDA